MWTIELIVIAVLIVFNGVFAGYEIALASIGTGRLQELAAQHRWGSAAALRMKRKIEASLAVVQVGITLAGAAAAATGGAGAEESIEPILRGWGLSTGAAQFLAIALVVAPLTVITILFGELVPKVFSLHNKDWVCLRLSPVMEWFSFSVWPAVWILENAVAWIMQWGAWGRTSVAEGRSEESAAGELRRAAALARTSRIIGRREEGIIVSASRLAATPIRQIVLPAEHISMLVIDQTLSQALVAAHQDMHTRFPVTEVDGNPQRIIGYVNFKDIVAAMRLSPHSPSLRNLVRRLHVFDAETSVADCLEYLMRQHSHIALVRGSDEVIIGLVTMEDIVEELVGEIHDEFDRMPAYLTPTGQGWIAGGSVTLSRLRDTVEIELPPLSEKPVLTLNDWVVERLGRPARGGDEIEADGWRILVRKTRRALVQEVYLCRHDAGDMPNT